MKLIEVVALAGAVLVMSGTYYFGYLKPADEFRYNMLDCMNDMSRTEYDRCLPIVKNQQG